MAGEQTPHPWLSDRAVSLQLQEVGATLELFQSTPDPLLTRRIFVSLCVANRSPEIYSFVQNEISAMPNFTYTRTWLTNLLYGVIHEEARYPFCLTDAHFRHYARTLFGDEIGDIQDIYHPPPFWSALLQDVGAVAAGALLSKAVPMAIPEAGVAASTTVSLASAQSRAMLSAAGGFGISKMLPGGSSDAANKDILWPRYLAEYQRRQIT